MRHKTTATWGLFLLLFAFASLAIGCAQAPAATAPPAATPGPSATVAPTATPTPEPACDAGWELVWYDEFDGEGWTNVNGLNPDHWNVETGICFNEEQQVYTTNTRNVRVREGVLVLEAHDSDPTRQDCPGCAAVARRRFTSGRINTKGKGEFLYGRFEARMRLPEGEGLWPAFWMLGADIDKVGWPECGEIDIMENLGYDDRISVAAHGPGYSGGASQGQAYPLPEGATTADWHTYRLDWTEEGLTWYVDDVKVYSLVRLALQMQDKEWVYDQPHFILLNLALGGQYPYSQNRANEPANGCYGLPQATIDGLPQQVQVDWVRVCQPSP